MAGDADHLQDKEISKGITMPKEEWGVKRICPTTGKRFYDLNKKPIVSPYTGETIEMHAGKSRTITADAEDAETKKMKDSDVEETLLDDEDDVDVDVELDDDVLDDDVLDDDDEDSVSLDEIADVAQEEDDS